MSNANDIKNLFAKFGGQPEGYRELALENDAVHSRARWPMLTAISPDQPEHPPGVAGRNAVTPSRRRPYLGFGAVRQSNADASGPTLAVVKESSPPAGPATTPAPSPATRVTATSTSAAPASAALPAHVPPAVDIAKPTSPVKTEPALRAERNVTTEPLVRPTLAAGKPLAFGGGQRLEPTLAVRQPVAAAVVPPAVAPAVVVTSKAVIPPPIEARAQLRPTEAPAVQSATPAQLTLRRLTRPAAVAIPQAAPKDPEPPEAAPSPTAGFGLPALLARLAGR